jgi:D-amino-acid oxidase
MADILVLGAGVNGLASAITLQQHGHRATIWTRDDPLATTSAVAAAIWLPYLAEPRERVLAWSATTLATLQQQAKDPTSGIRTVRTIEVFQDPEPDIWWLPAVPGARRLPRHEVPAPFSSAVELEVPLCDTTRYLPWLLAQFHARGGKLERREVTSLEQGFAAADTIVNCTGLGARSLCQDSELRPVRGQVLKLRGVQIDHAWIDDTTSQPIYVLPRHDDIIVGGTAQRDDENLRVDAADSARMLADAYHRFPQLKGATVASAAVGLRPFRDSIRLEATTFGPGRKVIHDYGHGGSGFTVAWGCAAEVAAILDSTIP